MPKYRKKPVETVEATQWNEWGDHDAVEDFSVRPHSTTSTRCAACDIDFDRHGWIFEGGNLVCPGDFIITRVTRAQGDQHYPCKPDIFAATYEAVS